MGEVQGGTKPQGSADFILAGQDLFLQKPAL